MAPSPIRDVSVPNVSLEAEWPARSARLRGLVKAGNRILVHCRGGLGRADMVATCLLVEMGADPNDAISALRRERDLGAIEIRAQEEWGCAGGRVPDSIDITDQATRDWAVGAILGIAVGDAVGATIEFSPKPERAMLSDMVGGGPFRLKPGQWNDDTAMALALAGILVADPAFDPGDLMCRFVSWCRDGTYSCTGRYFDIGVTTPGSLRRHELTGERFAGPTSLDTGERLDHASRSGGGPALAQS